MTNSLRQQVKNILEDMDERGAWVERGTLKYHRDREKVREIIDPRTFAENIQTLAEFLAASRE